MPFSSGTIESLRRIFYEGFVVRDIAEPLISFDEVTSVDWVRRSVEAQGIELIGVRRAGRVDRFLHVADLGDGTCGDHATAIDDEMVVDATASLADLVVRLRERRRLFVSVLGGIGGIVSRTDLQKPPVRMWLFGLVTLVEMRLVRQIGDACAGDSWREYLSEARVAKAEALQAERRRRGQSPSLLDCLQFSDKAQIVARNEQLRSTTKFESRRQLERVAAMLERLRNNLAHSQDIISHDWDAIVLLAERLDDVLSGPKGKSAS